MKKFLNYILCASLGIFVLFGLTACNSNDGEKKEDKQIEEKDKENKQDEEKNKEAETEKNSSKDAGIQDRTLTVCIREPINNFSPDGGTAMAQGQVMRQVFETLFERTEEGKLEPWLVENFEWANNTELILKLHEGVKFNNGEELTGEDVLYTIKYIQDNHTTAFDYVSSIDVENSHLDGDYKVHLLLKSPTPDLCEMLQHPFTGIRCKSASTDYTVTESAVGTGPYKVTGFVPGASYDLAMNEDYWNKDAFPHVKKIEIRVISDGTTRTNEALAGTTDLVYAINANDTAMFKDNSDVKYYEAPTGGTEYLTINTGSANKAMADPKVREAIFYAIDREAINEAGRGDYGKRQTNLLADIDGAADTSAYSGTYDPEKAKALLAEAGYKDGDVSVAITVINAARERMNEAEAIASQLKAVGINASVDPVAGNVCQEKIMQGETEMAIYGVTATTFEATMMLRKYLPESVYHKMFSLENQELFDLIEDAQKLLDVKERYAKYAEAQEIIAKSYCAYPICTMTFSNVSTTAVEGFWMAPSYQQHLLQYVYFAD